MGDSSLANCGNYSTAAGDSVTNQATNVATPRTICSPTQTFLEGHDKRTHVRARPRTRADVIFCLGTRVDVASCSET